MDISARFVDSEETEVLKHDHFLSFPHEFGEILIRRIPQRMEETVTIFPSDYGKRDLLSVSLKPALQVINCYKKKDNPAWVPSF